ncbi:MAG: hypothetical protein LBU18_04685 [Treponema sp.]|jgi:hypothetical protein|nr:hypothetical protein [Treponema sp.]
MTNFDISLDWLVLVPPSRTARLAGADLARIIGLLREQEGLPQGAALLSDALRDAPDEDVPIILLNSGQGRNFENGFSWRLGAKRLEIFGASERGLCNGVYDFLSALGVIWPEPGREDLPPSPASGDGVYPVENSSAHRPSETDPAKTRRFVMSGEIPPDEWEAALLWAVRGRMDEVVLPPQEGASFWAWISGAARRRRKRLRRMAKDYALLIGQPETR